MIARELVEVTALAAVVGADRADTVTVQRCGRVRRREEDLHPVPVAGVGRRVFSARERVGQVGDLQPVRLARCYRDSGERERNHFEREVELVHDVPARAVRDAGLGRIRRPLLADQDARQAGTVVLVDTDAEVVFHRTTTGVVVSPDIVGIEVGTPDAEGVDGRSLGHEVVRMDDAARRDGEIAHVQNEVTAVVAQLTVQVALDLTGRARIQREVAHRLGHEEAAENLAQLPVHAVGAVGLAAVRTARIVHTRRIAVVPAIAGA